MDMQSNLGTTVDILRSQLRDAADEMRMGIQNCLSCAQSCESLVQHCLRQGGEHASPDHIRLLQDCADACLLAAKFMLRESDFHSQLCGVCASICTRCAEDCERMADDLTMQQCAEICRRCADSCSAMELSH